MNVPTSPAKPSAYRIRGVRLMAWIALALWLLGISLTLANLQEISPNSPKWLLLAWATVWPLVVTFALIMIGLAAIGFAPARRFFGN